MASLLLIGLVILTALAPVIFLNESDRILLLKLGAIAFLALFPGRSMSVRLVEGGETLRDEYILNLHKLRVDSYGNLPPPPKGSLFRRDDDERTIDDEEVQRNLYLQKFDAIYGVRVLHKVANEDDGRSEESHELPPDRDVHGAPRGGMDAHAPARADLDRQHPGVHHPLRAADPPADALRFAWVPTCSSSR